MALLPQQAVAPRLDILTLSTLYRPPESGLWADGLPCRFLAFPCRDFY